MLVIFCVIIIQLYVADAGNRYRARQEIKYANQKKPFLLKILLPLLWAPKKRNPNFCFRLARSRRLKKWTGYNS